MLPERHLHESPVLLKLLSSDRSLNELLEERSNIKGSDLIEANLAMEYKTNVALHKFKGNSRETN